MPRPSVHVLPFACPHPDTFETFIRQEFLARYRTSEAAREVTAFAKETTLTNAVNLAIESLPTAKSKVLRRLVDEYLPWCQVKLAFDIWQAARPFVQSFNGEWVDVDNPYQGKLHVQVRLAYVKAPIPERAAQGDSIPLIVGGDYAWKDDPKGASQTSFSFDIVVHPDLTVELREQMSGGLDYAPKEMVSGLKKALER